MNTNQATRPQQVHIRIDDDADAVRITGVLEALGYQVVRELDDEGAGDRRLGWALERLTRAHRLTKREAEVLAGVLDGHDNTSLARVLSISRATVKWHMHNLFCKCGVANREALLRAALQLRTPKSDEGTSEPNDPHWAGPHDVTKKIE